MRAVNTRAAVCSLVALLLLAGCSSKPVSLSAGTELKVLPQDSKLVELPPPAISKQDGVLVITGIVKRKAGFDGPIPGHLDVEFLNSKGQEVNMLRLNWVPRQLPTSGSRESSYDVHYAWIPPAGSSIKICYHEGWDTGTGGGVGGGSGGGRVGPVQYNTPGGQVKNWGYGARPPVSIPVNAKVREGEYAPGYFGYGRRR